MSPSPDGHGTVRAAQPLTIEVNAPCGPHGGDAIAVARYRGIDPARLLDLSASLNPFAPAIDAIAEHAAPQLGRYPDDGVATVALATAIGVDPECLVLTNGASEAIALIAALEPIGEVVTPEFSLYERHLAEVRPGAPRWRSNPSNPLGQLAPSTAAAHVWDEAFWPLATGTWTRGDEDAWRIGSLTKLWACPGVRIGFAIAPAAGAARRLAERRPRWSVNALALLLIEELLPLSDLVAWSSAIAAQRRRMLDMFTDRGLAVRATETNWVLVDEPRLRDRLLDHDVLVRDCASFGMPGTFRVAVPDHAGLDRLQSALDAAGFGR